MTRGGISVSQLAHLRDAPFDIWGGGGVAGKKLKKIIYRHKSQKKKFVENAGRKKSLLSKLMKNMLTKKTPNGNVHNRESIRQKNYSTKHKKKNCRTLIAKKKNCFLSEVKTSLQATKTLAPPPQISNGASPSFH